METARIAELLAPFTGGETLPARVLDALPGYLDLLLRWNARMNLTAVREPENIVTRHFGESLFAGRLLLRGVEGRAKLVDVGSGAGFPGIPIKLLDPALDLTLIEVNYKKAVFLREVVRSLGLERVEVFCSRAEDWTKTGTLVTLRAVEQFDRVLTVAASLVSKDGRLGLLIGLNQVPIAQKVLGDKWCWSEPVAVPLSQARVVLIANRAGPINLK